MFEWNLEINKRMIFNSVYHEFFPFMIYYSQLGVSNRPLKLTRPPTSTYLDGYRLRFLKYYFKVNSKP